MRWDAGRIFFFVSRSVHEIPYIEQHCMRSLVLIYRQCISLDYLIVAAKCGYYTLFPFLVAVTDGSKTNTTYVSTK